MEHGGFSLRIFLNKKKSESDGEFLAAVMFYSVDQTLKKKHISQNKRKTKPQFSTLQSGKESVIDYFPLRTL